VSLEEEGAALPGARQPRDKVRAARLARVQLGLDARLGEHAAEELDALRLVSRRVRGVEADQLLEQFDRGHGNRKVKRP
jgi:hypothetical protein